MMPVDETSTESRAATDGEASNHERFAGKKIEDGKASSVKKDGKAVMKIEDEEAIRMKDLLTDNKSK
eukprot:8659522-Karenia_brevis.AAC.1